MQQSIQIEQDITIQATVPPKKQIIDNQQIGPTDLLPKIYEGGFKIWECSLDLVRYLSGMCVKESYNSVLELGCGHALPSIFCITRSLTKTATVQDFNKEVIDRITKNNFEINAVDQDAVQYIHSSWGAMSNKGEKSFNLILSSETIYDIQSYQDLHSVFDNYLTIDGAILIAAKAVYYGVSGSIFLFQKFIQEREKFSCKIVKEIENQSGSSRRCILELKRRSSQNIQKEKENLQTGEKKVDIYSLFY